MSPKTKKFKNLQEKWYRKLKESGFSDIEYSDGSIQACHPRSVQGLDPLVRETVADYYRMCDHFLYAHKFANELEKIVWEYHSNGLSARDIAKILKETKVKDTSKDTVCRMIKALEDRMKHLYLST